MTTEAADTLDVAAMFQELGDTFVDDALKLAAVPDDEYQRLCENAVDEDGVFCAGQVTSAARSRAPQAPGRTYQSSPTKRTRRTKAEIEAVRQAIYDVLEEDQPMTVRQVFYRLVSSGVIDKSEGQYKNTVVRLLGVMRREGQVPFGWIADATRWQRKPRTYSSLENALRDTVATYRRAVWDCQDAYVEVWLEKEALAGVLLDVTAPWDVPLMVTRGYPSLSYLYEAAEAMASEQRPCHLYYFGDRDPSGIDIPRKIETDLREFAPDVELHFERVAVTLEQVDEWGLQTRPTKKTDSRAKRFDGESVEVDAIPPATLRQLCEECIVQHIDVDTYNRMQRVEEAERETLQGMIDRMEVSSR